MDDLSKNTELIITKHLSGNNSNLVSSEIF